MRRGGEEETSIRWELPWFSAPHIQIDQHFFLPVTRERLLSSGYVLLSPPQRISSLIIFLLSIDSFSSAFKHNHITWISKNLPLTLPSALATAHPSPPVRQLSWRIGFTFSQLSPLQFTQLIAIQLLSLSLHWSSSSQEDKKPVATSFSRFVPVLLFPL